MGEDEEAPGAPLDNLRGNKLAERGNVDTDSSNAVEHPNTHSSACRRPELVRERGEDRDNKRHTAQSTNEITQTQTQMVNKAKQNLKKGFENMSLLW